MAYKIQFEKAAAKQLSKIERRVQVKIAEKTNALAFDPRPYGYKKLVDKGETNADAAWYYPEASEAAKNVEGFVAFWRGVTVER